MITVRQTVTNENQILYTVAIETVTTENLFSNSLYTMLFC
ncbi:MAG: hypothetical protein ACI90V_001617 [Bacillariaceae sp.]|jgi:hypothetical protein